MRPEVFLTRGVIFAIVENNFDAPLKRDIKTLQLVVLSCF